MRQVWLSTWAGRGDLAGFLLDKRAKLMYTMDAVKRKWSYQEALKRGCRRPGSFMLIGGENGE